MTDIYDPCNNNLFAHVVPLDQPKHFYHLTFCFTGQSPFALSPMQVEPHRWAPIGRESLGIVPKDPEAMYRIILHDSKNNVIAEHVGRIDLSYDWRVENVEDTADFVSSIVWRNGMFESVCIKMEYHLQGYRKW